MKTIDVHSHTLPKVYVEALKAGVVRNNDNFPIPEWTLEKHIKMMEHNDVQACVLSVSAPGLRCAGLDAATNLARAINIQHAEIVE